jgi:hypothetical protein
MRQKGAELANRKCLLKGLRMQLTAFRILKYRNIEDSGLIKLADHLTCIVGKNQSGKTNLLRGLHKFNPHDKSVKYDARRDWPRGGRRTRDETQVVCEAHFDLDAEQDELAGLTDSAMRMPKAVVTKNYTGQYAVEFPDHPDFFPNRVHQRGSNLREVGSPQRTGRRSVLPRQW